ncbi:MAG TPA: hypothetical protein VMP01_17485 [Pirellulaceae bacterium]|nr:hypothetical protein [Pirellulaceae bacterium]
MAVARRPSLVLMVVCSVCCCWQTSRLQASDALKRQVLEEAPRAWEFLRKRAENRSIVTLMTTSPAEGERSVGKFMSKARGRCQLFIEELITSSGEPRKDAPEPMRVNVYGMNEHYYFQLRAATRDGPYKLVKLQRLPSDAGPDDVPIDLVRLMWESRNLGMAIEVEALPEIFKKPYFELLSAEQIVEGDETYIRCKIAYDQPRDETTFPFGVPLWSTSFQVDLDPRNHYRIRRVTTEHDWPIQKKTYLLTDELRETNPGEAGVYLREYTSVDKATNQVDSSTKYEFLELSYGSPAKSDFYLSAFGLPEPPGVRKPGIPAFVWVGGAGIVLVIVAFVVQRRRKER